MKKKIIVSSLIALFLLAGCTTNPGGNEPTPEPTPGPTPEPGPVEPIHIDTSFTFKILSSNDIHGQVDPENPTAYYGRSGIGKYLSYAKHIKDTEQNVLLVDQGDTFQGSIYSNENRGALITKAMAYAHYDARAIGNHDFDWGLEPLRNNKSLGYNGYVVPTLGANIYNYNFESKQFLSTHCDELCDSTTICEFSNGFKVGIIGTIGSITKDGKATNQITSICTPYVKDINFKPHVQIIKQEATKLRNQGCHFIISLHHGDVAELVGQGLSSYIDIGLAAHTHRLQSEVENGVHFYQMGEYTEYLGNFTFSFNASSQKTTLSNSNLISSADIEASGISVDPVLQDMIDDAKVEVRSRMNPDEIVAANVNGAFDDYGEGPNLMAKAMYDTAIAEGYDIDLAYCNQLRHDLGGTSWTFDNIYQAAPFDNIVYIYDATYEEIRDEVKKYNYIYKPSGEFEVSPGHTYKIAVLDYLLFHSSPSRHFDYFPSMENKFAQRDSFQKLNKTYRYVLKDWLASNGYSGSKTLSSSDYDSSITNFNRSEIVTNKVTVTLHWNDGRGDDDVIDTLTVAQGNPFWYSSCSADKTDEKIVGWYLDREMTSEKYFFDGQAVTSSIDLYACWASKSRDWWTNLDSYNTSAGQTNTNYPILNDYDESVSLNIKSTALEEPQYSSIRLPGDGYMLFTLPSGYKFSYFRVSQYAYRNLVFYSGSSAVEANKLTMNEYDYDTDKTYEFPGYDANVSQIYMKNTYSGTISILGINIGITTTS